jgi:hypothetical protein
MLSKIRIRVSSCSSYVYFMSFLLCINWFKRFISFACESLVDLFPETLTTSLTVFEIVYYFIACLYFLVELIVLLISLFK